MKMDGFGKFFDQPSCEFGGKYMEVREGGRPTEIRINVKIKTLQRSLFFLFVLSYFLSFILLKTENRTFYSYFKGRRWGRYTVVLNGGSGGGYPKSGPKLNSNGSGAS